MRVLVTRDAASGLRTAAALAIRGHQALCEPLTCIVPPPYEPFPDSMDAILLTSPNAAEVFSHRAAAFLRTPVLAVGARTASVARALGFAYVHSADGDAEDLLALVRSCMRPGAVLAYPAPAHAARDLGREFGADYEVLLRIVYRLDEADALSAAACQTLRSGEIGAVLHFSRTASRAYLQLAETAGLVREALRPEQLCLSERIAAPLRNRGVCVRVAEKPNESALIALVEG